MRGDVDPAELFAALADLVDRRPAWHRDALCREPAYRSLPWVPERGDDVRACKAVCARCAVRGECADYAVGHDGPTTLRGIWGGLSERERRAMRAGRAA